MTFFTIIPLKAKDLLIRFNRLLLMVKCLLDMCSCTVTYDHGLDAINFTNLAVELSSSLLNRRISLLREHGQ